MRNLEAGGIGAFLMNVYRKVDREKIQFDFAVTASGMGILGPEIERMGGRVFFISENGTKNVKDCLLQMYRLYKVCKENRYDVVHSQCYFSNAYFLLCARLAGVRKLVSHCHNNFTQPPSFLKRCFEVVSRPLLLRVATDCLGCSDAATRYLYGEKAFRSGKAHTLYNGIDYDLWNPNNYDVPALRQAYGLTNEKVAVFIGRMEKQKNPIFALRVMKEVHKQNPAIKLFFVGMGSYDDEVDRFVSENNMTGYVKRMPQDTNVRELQAMADVMIAPSLWEGLSIAFIEAQIMGTPIVTSDMVSDEIDMGLCSFLSLDKFEDWPRRVTEILDGRENFKITKQMKKLLLSLMMFACFQISFNTSFVKASVPNTLGLPDDYILLEEFYVKNVCRCGTKLDNVYYITTSDDLPLKVYTYLEGRKINLILINENQKSVRFNLVCNGFVHPYDDPVGKEKVDSEYTYSKTLAQGESEKFTIGHRSMIPIIGHGGVPGNIDLGNGLKMEKAYLGMLYAGFDVSICDAGKNTSKNMLKRAMKKGMKLVIGGGKTVSYSALVDSVRDLKSSIYAYYIGDEPFLQYNSQYPNHTTIDSLAPIADSIRQIDSKANIRVCLNPIYGPETIKEDKTYDNQMYSDYIDSCVLKLGLKTIAFDNYSIIKYQGDEVLRRQWFDNLEIIRSKSIKYGIPFCGYVLSAKHLDYLTPTLGKMRLQMYANLAYGAKSIAYYTYWHRWLSGEGAYVAPIDSFGQRRAELYDTVNRVNEEMARISPLFAEGTVKRVFHMKGKSAKPTDELAPSNTLVKELDQNHLPDNISSLSIEDDKNAGAIASIITKGDSSFLAIVNKDFRNPIKLHITGNKYLYHVSKLNLKNEAITTGDYTIDAGDILIFNLTQRRSKIPIVAYWGVPEDKASVEAYDELYNAGFDISLRPINKEKKAERILQFADSANVKVLLGKTGYNYDDSYLVRNTKDFKSLSGYIIRDEPDSAQMTNVKNRINNIHKINGDAFCYIKAKPAFYYGHYQDNNGVGFLRYIDSICSLDIKAITYRYKVFRPENDGELDNNWYKYLEVISMKSMDNNKDFWGSIQCTKLSGTIEPSLEKLRLQANVNLAYGAKALEYLYYWNPENDFQDYSHSPINCDGTRNDVIYNWVNQLNEEIAEVSSLFANGHIEDIYHLGDSSLDGTKNYKDYIDALKLHISPQNASESKGAVISFLKNGDKSYMVIVNKDFSKKQTFLIRSDYVKSDEDNLQLPKLLRKRIKLSHIKECELDEGGIKVYELTTNLSCLKKNNNPKVNAELKSQQKTSVNNIQDTHTPLSVQIYTTSGANVYSGPISDEFIDNNNFDIDLPVSLRRGKCYIIKINRANNSYVKKISL